MCQRVDLQVEDAEDGPSVVRGVLHLCLSSCLLAGVFQKDPLTNCLASLC
jgi:hypothetical protein